MTRDLEHRRLAACRDHFTQQALHFWGFWGSEMSRKVVQGIVGQFVAHRGEQPGFDSRAREQMMGQPRGGGFSVGSGDAHHLEFAAGVRIKDAREVC